jgi:hypothetical protein
MDWICGSKFFVQTSVQRSTPAKKLSCDINAFSALYAVVHVANPEFSIFPLFHEK